MMKFMTLGALLCAPAVALAEPVTRTVTIDTPRYEGSRTATRDREAGTVVRDATVTRREDGAVATRHFERRRTAEGVSGSGTATGFNGGTRSFEFSRVRGAEARRLPPRRPHRVHPRRRGG